MQSTRVLGLQQRILAQSFRNAPAARVARAVPVASSFMPVRKVSSVRAPTTQLSEAENLELLNEQRSLRPSSPHFTIYQPQLTWLASIANRVTGAGLSVALYGYALAYLAAPYAGLGEAISSAGLTDLVAMAPVWLKIGLKAPLAAAASFHTFNGLRHLAWDWGYFLSLKGAYSSGYAVLAATTASTVGLCMI